MRVPRGVHRTDRIDRGQAALLVIVVAAVLLVVLVSGLTLMGRGAIDRTRAQTAADAASLAALDGGQAAAAELAVKHGGELISVVILGDTVTVEVRVGVATARARSSDRP